MNKPKESIKSFRPGNKNETNKKPVQRRPKRGKGTNHKHTQKQSDNQL